MILIFPTMKDLGAENSAHNKNTMLMEALWTDFVACIVLNVDRIVKPFCVAAMPFAFHLLG